MNFSIEKLVTKYLDLTKSQVHKIGDCLFVNLNENPERVYAITFSKEEAEKQGCELVGLGTPFFKLITNDIRRRGSILAKIPAADPSGILKLISCGNCKLELVTAEEIQQNALKLYCLLTVLTTKRRQKFVEVAIDGSGQEAQWLYNVRDLISDDKPKKFEKESLQFLLERAIQILKDKIDQELNDLRKESEYLLSESINRIQNYYAQLRDETINQAEYVRSQKQNGSVRGKRPIFSNISFEEAERLISEYDKLEASDIERERARYQIRAKATLVAALLLNYSSFRCHLLFRNLNGSASKDIFLNLLPNGEIENPILCDSCKQPIKEVYLCSGGHLVGDECMSKTSNENLCIICENRTEKKRHLAFQ